MVYEVKLTYKKDEKNSHFRKKYYVYSISREEAITKVTKAIKIKSVIGVMYRLEDISAKELPNGIISTRDKYIPPVLRRILRYNYRKNILGNK